MTIAATETDPAQRERRISIADQIAAQLRDDILSAVIEPGAPLRQDHVAQRFNVSQAPVREALRQLASENLVTYQVNCGVRVPLLERAEAEETARLRLKLEPDLVAAATRNFSVADRRHAETAIDLIASAKNVPSLLQANEAFHDAIYRPAGRPVTLQMVHQLRQRYARYLGFMWKHSRHAEASLDEHRELLELMRKGKAKAARKRLKAHIGASTDAILDALAGHHP